MNKADEKEFLGSGWSFPVRFSWNTGELQLSHYEANIEENIQVLVHTRRGEHPLEQLFGLGLQQFVFRKLDDTLKGDIIDAVKTTLLNYEPRIKVLDVQVVFDEVKEGLVHIQIDYEYNQTNTRHNYIFPFHLNEGTNLSVHTT
jgi:phage baseplate assembly protein W